MKDPKNPKNAEQASQFNAAHPEPTESTKPAQSSDSNTSEKSPKSSKKLEIGQAPTSHMPEHEFEPASTYAPTLTVKKSRWHHLVSWVKAHKRKSAAIAAAILLVPIAIVALTDLRFSVMNLFMQSSLHVVALDDQNQPVSAAEVSVKDIKATTDSKGHAKITGAIYGQQTVKIYKEGYRPVSESVKVTSADQEQKITLAITGVRVKATVRDTLSGKPLKGVKLSFGKNNSQSDDKGKITIVVPPGTDKFTATAALNGYVQASVEMKKDDSTEFTLTPAGKIYFLSKRSGKIDVMSSNLDGSDQKVVVAGTGNELDGDTSLLATRDWKYLALKAKRDNADKVYLISTASGDTLSTIDTSPNANFTLHGWSGATLIYTANNLKNSYSAPGNQAIKGFNAGTGRSFSFDESQVETVGSSQYVREFSAPQIVSGDIIYGRTWSGLDPARQQEVVVATMEGQKKVVHSQPASEVYNYDLLSYNSREVWIGAYSQHNTALYEYDDGKISKVNGQTADALNQPYPTYLLSPDGTREVVDESRDGKHVISIRAASGEGAATEVLSMTDYTIYGWYGNYLLLAKDASELYVLDPATIKSPKEPTKIGSYHKPQINYRGYGYGYGGF